MPIWWSTAPCLIRKPACPGPRSETAEHIFPITERNSADAERDSKDVKLFAFPNAQLAIRPAASPIPPW